MDDNINGLGRVIILNGAPRSGKSSIAKAIQDTFEGVWINFGVDRYKEMIPKRFQPGIGLRPGGEAPELEPLVATLYLAMYESIAAHCRRGVNVVADTGHHDFYSAPLNILPQCARLLNDYSVLFVGLKCPLDVIMERRIATWGASYGYVAGGGADSGAGVGADGGAVGGFGGGGAGGGADKVAPEPVRRWQSAVHENWEYDMEFDTSEATPEAIAAAIRERLRCGAPPSAFRRLA